MFWFYHSTSLKLSLKTNLKSLFAQVAAHLKHTFYFQNCSQLVGVGNAAKARCVPRIRTCFFFRNPTFFGDSENINFSVIGNVFTQHIFSSLLPVERERGK